MRTRPDADHPLLTELTERVRALQEPLRRFSDEPFVHNAQRRIRDCVSLIEAYGPKAQLGDKKYQDAVTKQFHDAFSQCDQLEAWLSRQSTA